MYNCGLKIFGNAVYHKQRGPGKTKQTHNPDCACVHAWCDISLQLLILNFCVFCYNWCESVSSGLHKKVINIPTYSVLMLNGI